MSHDFDICVVGSGAGAGPVIYTLAHAGYKVLVLEKGPWYTEQDYFKDELKTSLRGGYTPDLRDEQHVVELENDDGSWRHFPTYQSSWNFWNGNVVGGSSNFMSGFFHRLKPNDFKLLSTYGPIEGANIVDWPISYEDMEPYYDKVEKVVGVSGRVIAHPFQEPRSSKDFPFPPTAEHPIAKHIDKACERLGFHSMPMPRAILSQPALNRKACVYSGYCGSYGCATGAKGGSRAALINSAMATGNCDLRPETMVTHIHSDKTGKVTAIEYIDKQGNKQSVDAKLYVVAAQAIETARLLLNSKGPKHPEGLANNNGQVGKNLIFAGGGAGSGRLPYDKFSPEQVSELKQFGTFINRSLQDWYEIRDKDLFKSEQVQKGGTIDFVHLHPNPVARANRQTRGNGGLLWGKPLKDKLKSHFTEGRYVKVEAFCDWSPTDNGHVSLDPKIKDKWGLPVAKIKVDVHVQNLRVGWYLANKSGDVLREMGAEDVLSFASGVPPTNLVAGACRFGTNPKTSVLNSDCQAHDVENLYVTDGSFMPTGGSVPHTWTIYANSFRVADKIVARLGGIKDIGVKV